MEGTGFRIRTNGLSQKVIFGLFFGCIIMTVVCLLAGPQSSFSEVYAKEVAEASSVLEIPSISLLVPVSKASLSGRTLSVPDYIVGEYKTYENKVLLMGHSSTAFANLSVVQLGDKISYDGVEYEVVSKEVKPKSEISMREILEDNGKKTIILMTCAGQHVSGKDYSHRLIVNAVVRGE